MSDEDFPQADQVDGAPHPRQTSALFGQAAAEAAFLDAFNSDRLHHAWLITGPRGVGKATLAWKIARFLLATPVPSEGDMFGAPPPPDTLEIDPNHPVHARIDALSEPGIFLLRRLFDPEKKRFKQDITVDETRKLKGFFALSSTDGGRRVVIVDAADDMNVNAANALLKLLEEPPANAVLLLISHQPARLLPTIRSRCRELRCNALDHGDIAQALASTGDQPDHDATAIAALSGGSVGEALRMINLDGVGLYQMIISVAKTFPQADRPQALHIANLAAARGAEAKFDLTITLLDLFLSRLSKTGLGLALPEAVPGELEVLIKLSPDPNAAQKWAGLAAHLGDRARHGRAVNLDPAALVLDMLLAMNTVARDAAA